MKNFFASLKAHILIIWAALTGEVKKIVPEAIAVVNEIKILIGNPVVDAVASSLTKGVLTPEIIAKVNGILTTLLAGFADAQDVSSMTPEEALVYFAKKIQGMNATQQAAIYTQLATELVKLTGGTEAMAETEIKLLINGVLSGIIATETAAPAQPATETTTPNTQEVKAQPAAGETQQ